jgi:hypothetical protein
VPQARGILYGRCAGAGFRRCRKSQLPVTKELAVVRHGERGELGDPKPCPDGFTNEPVEPIPQILVYFALIKGSSA